MAIDPQLTAWFGRLATQFGPLPNAGAAARRERFLAITPLLRLPDPPGLRFSVLKVELPGRTLEAELYHPGGTPPLMVYAHGGGWVVGSVATHRDFLQRVAARAGVAILSLDYRLAPEYPFPAPCDDMFDALGWAQSHAGALGIDGARIGVGGDSAGAHLAAGAAIAARDPARPALALQWLVYPVIEPVFDHRSSLDFGTGPGLTTADMRYFWGEFLPQGLEIDDPIAVPSRAATLAGLAPAFVVTAEFDPLCDEGERYAAMLAAAGVPVRLVRAEGMTHGFARLGPVCDRAARHLDDAIAALKAGFA